jgi:hypothetical protein
MLSLLADPAVTARASHKKRSVYFKSVMYKVEQGRQRTSDTRFVQSQGVLQSSANLSDCVASLTQVRRQVHGKWFLP